MSVWYPSYAATPFDINKMALTAHMSPESYESDPRRLSMGHMLDDRALFNYRQQLAQRPGSSCSIASNSSETAVIPPINNKNYQESRYKTELCRHWQENGTCPHGLQCLFAHGLNELKPFRGRHRKYKTQLCKAFHSDGFCSFGPRCSYIHSGVDIIPGAIRPIPSEPTQYQRKLSTESIDSTLESAEQLEERFKMMSVASPIRPIETASQVEGPPTISSTFRLSVFAKMCDNSY